MKTPRSTQLVAGVVLLVAGTTAVAQPVKPAAPTDEQLTAAVKAFQPLNGRFEKLEDPNTKQTYFVFRLDPSTTDDDLKTIPLLPFAFGLDLLRAKVTDTGVKELPRLKNLAWLRLDSTKVTDAGLKELLKLKQLTLFDVGATKVTDTGLKEIANCTSLVTLYIGATRVTDEGLKELAKLNHLRLLNLELTVVSDAGLKEVARLKNLASLTLANTRVTDVGLKELAPLQNLAALNLSDTKVSDVGLKELARLKKLSTLDLRGTKVTAAGVAELQKALPRCVIQRDEKAAGSVEAIDAHTHFYDPHRPQGVPWPGKGDKLLYRAVLPAELKELTKKQHVQGTIVVEASPWLEDNQWLLDLAAKEPFIVGVVGRLDPAGADFPKHLGRFARDPLFRGIRINHDELRRGLSQPRFIEHLGLLAERALALDVNGGPDMPADVATLAQKLPRLRIVINHAANLTIDGKPVPPAWLKGMREAAAGKQVFCKVSALVEGTRKRNGDAPTAVDFYRPTLDALWQTFGEDRLIYGSNWPVSDHAASYATVYDIPRQYVEKRGAGAAEKFFRLNAVTAYKPVIRSPKEAK